MVKLAIKSGCNCPDAIISAIESTKSRSILLKEVRITLCNLCDDWLRPEVVPFPTNEDYSYVNGAQPKLHCKMMERIPIIDGWPLAMKR